jgi:glycosyltransferase involved in cell wall biosynthesis
LKVLHVIDKSFLGGGQTAVRHLIAGAIGTDIAPMLTCRDGGPLVDVVRAMGVPVFPLPFDKRFRPGPARALAGLVRAHGVDVLHGHGLVATTYATLARTFFGARVPLVYQQHGFHHHNYRAYSIALRRASEKAVCRRADRVIAVSRADAARLVDERYAAAPRVDTVYYGVPEPAPAASDASAALRAELGLDSARPVVGLIGRLHPQKGVDVFLQAVAEVRRQVPECQFVVVGTGEVEAELRGLASRLGLDGTVRWAGGRASAPFLPILDVAVLTSRWEGLPLVLLELMASGRAIVTTSVPGCLEAVGADAAEVVPIDAPAAAAQAIVRLLRAPEHAAQRGRRARERYLEQFTLQVMTRRFQALYQELVA